MIYTPLFPNAGKFGAISIILEAVVRELDPDGWLDEADAEKTLLLVLLGVAKNQKYITQKKLLELQGKLEEIGRIIGGLQKFFINNRK